MRPNIEELKSIWMHAYSKAAFYEAISYVDAMETVEPDSTLCHGLVSAATVTYARPFTFCRFARNESVIPLKGVEPPTELKTVHEKFVVARHQTIGHKDAKLTEGELPVTVLAMKRGPRKASFYPLGVHELKPWAREQMKELCSHFIKHCDGQLRPLMDKYQSEFLSRPQGTYRLVLCEAPTEWLELFDKSWVIPLKEEPFTQ